MTLSDRALEMTECNKDVMLAPFVILLNIFVELHKNLLLNSKFVIPLNIFAELLHKTRTICKRRACFNFRY